MKRTSSSVSAVLPPQAISPRAKAFTIMELLVVMAIIATLLGLLFPAIRAVWDSAHKTVAKNAEIGLAVGVSNYCTDYGYFPDLGTTGADTFVAADNYRLMDILRGHDTTRNPTKTPYFTYKNAKGISKLRDGYDPSGNLLDPWGHQYKLKYDTDYDHDIMVYGETVSMDAVVWSVGRNGVEVPNYTMLRGSDDVVSWR